MPTFFFPGLPRGVRRRMGAWIVKEAGHGRFPTTEQVLAEFGYKCQPPSQPQESAEEPAPFENSDTQVV